MGSSADPTPGQLQKKIDRNNSLIGGHKSRERVLTSDISSQTRRINTLQSDIARLSARQQKLQTSLDAKRAELAAVQRRLRQERARLTRLRARLIVVRRALAQRLVYLYKADPPDAVTVVLESDGFADLVSRTEFMTRVSKQDARIMDIVSDAKRTRPRPRRAWTGSRSARSGSRRRSSPSATRCRPCASGVVDRRDRIVNARATKVALVRSSRDRRHELQDEVEELREAQAKVQARLAGFSGPVSAGPIKPGSGGLIWPVNGPITSPFCETRSWESCHPGIDIGVPAGTPIRAAGAGKVVLMQSAGVVRRLRELHLRPARRRAVDVLRAPVAVRHVAGRGRVAGSGHRLRWMHRPLLRGSPALRDPDQRRVNPMNYL